MNNIHAEIDTLLDFGEWQKAKDLIATLIDPAALATRKVKAIVETLKGRE